MKYLIIIAHPNPKSFNNAIKEEVTKYLDAQKHEYVIRDLYELQFDPVLKASDFEKMQSGNTPNDIKKEQDYILWADSLIFIHPIWWQGTPAILKGYIDRVLSYGFAYKYGPNGPEGLLSNKKAYVISTAGNPDNVMEQLGLYKAMNTTIDTLTLEFCGIKVLKHHYFAAVPSVSDAIRKQYLEEVKAIFA